MIHRADCFVLARVRFLERWALLIEKDFAMLSSSRGGVANPAHAGPIRFRALKEPTVPADHIAHSVLRGPVKLYT